MCCKLCGYVVRVCVHLSARWHTARISSKMTVFRQSTSKNLRRKGASKCVICDVGSIFWGSVLWHKIFPIKWSSVRPYKFSQYICAQTLRSPVLEFEKLQNLKAHRRFFSEIVQYFALYKICSENPKRCTISEQGPTENATFNKSCNFWGPLVQIV